MYLSLKSNKTHKEHKVLLLLSVVVVSSFLYVLFDGYKEITTPLVKQPLVKERVLALVINPAPMKKEVVKKEVIKEIKKEKVVKKETPKPLKKEVVKRDIVKEEVIEEKVVEEIVQEVVEKEPVVQKPIVDAKAKESFIAGLYEILNENKHYPKMAKKRKLEGICEVSFTLTKNGELKDIFLKEACEHDILNKAALKVVSSISFYKPIPDSVSLSALHLNIPIKYARN